MELTIDQIRDMLPINKHSLDQHLMVRSEITERIARKIAQLELRLEDKKALLKRQAAAVELKARKSPEKLTVGEVANAVLLDPACAALSDEVRSMGGEVDEWKALALGWKDQGFDLRGLVDLYQLAYFALDPAGSSRMDRPRTDYTARRSPHQPDPDREPQRPADGTTTRRRTRV